MKLQIGPRCHDAAFDPQSGRYHFLLEDLSATHEHTLNPLPPPPRALEQAVERLAYLHAAWWNDPRLGAKIGRPFLEERGSRRAITIRKRADKFLAFLGDRVSGSRRQTLEDLKAAYPRLIERQSTGPLTIVHGDTHFENFVAARDQSDCRIIDWENWEIAPGTDDLAYTLALLCFAEQRKQSEQALLRRYHRTLLAAGVAGYTWDALWNDYRLSVIKHLCTPVYHWANGVLPPVWWNNLERVLTAYEDLGCAQIMAELNGA